MSSHAHWLRAAGAIAGRQRSLITSRQLDACGLSRSGREKAAAKGWLVRIHRGVFVLPGVKPTWETQILAAVLAAGQEAVASHLTAAKLWSLFDGDPPVPIRAIHVTAPTLHRLDRVEVHRQVLAPMEITRCRDVPVTTAARTLFDLGNHLNGEDLGRCLDEAIRRDLVRPRDVARLVALHGGAGRRRLASLHVALGERLPGYNPGANPWELRMDRMWDRLGLPPAQRQYWVTAGGRRYRLDRAIVALRLDVEWVGAEYHMLAGRYRRDRRRTSDLIQAGWDVVEIMPDWPPPRIFDTVMAKVAERQLLLAQ